MAFAIADRSIGAIAALVVVWLLAIGTVNAADQGKEGREIARRVQLLQQEKSQMGVKLKAVSDQLSEASKAVEEGKRGAEQSKRELSASRKAKAELAERLAKLEEEHRALQASFEETSAARTQLEAEKRNLERVAAEQLSALGRQSRMIESCRQNNVELHRLGSDLLARLRMETKSSVVSIFGFGEVDGFNLDQEYRDKLSRLRVDASQTNQ